MKRQSPQFGYSFAELMAVVAILGIIAALILPRIANRNDQMNSGACNLNKQDIELQAEIWMHNKDQWPLADLSDIEADAAYFPEGLPSCPVDSTAYTIDAQTGRVVGHNH